MVPRFPSFGSHRARLLWADHGRESNDTSKPAKRTSRMRLTALALLLPAVLGACRAAPDVVAVPEAVTGGRSPALSMMEQVATAAQTCWFASRDPAFANFRLANELNSFSGRPRILLVPAANPEARPLLVVQAEGAPARLDAFGPVMQSAEGSRVAADLTRWSQGSRDCA